MEIDDTTTRGDDVTIYLVTEEESRERKRRKQVDGVLNYGTPEGEIQVDSRKLRQCSKYFEACMSERWTSDSATQRFEFYLELQTELMYYTDCFARMNFSFPKPITHVGDCIQLLKVASQIQYQDLVNACMKILATMPWDHENENQIREFCNSGYCSASSDLKARLDLSLTKKERQKKHLELTKKTLSQHFALAWNPIPRDLESLESGDCRIPDVLDNRKLFAEAFRSIMSEMGHELQEHLMTLVIEASEKTLISLSNDPDDEETVHVDPDVTRILWLYEMTRSGNGSQVIVELILKNDEVRYTLETAELEVQVKFANLVHYMFEDMLNGHLFLTTLERRTLFSTWNWMFNEEFMQDFTESEWGSESALVDFVTDIVMTFPLLEQEEIFRTWVVNQSTESLLSQYYTTWLSGLIKKVAKCQDEDDSAEEM